MKSLKKYSVCSLLLLSFTFFCIEAFSQTGEDCNSVRQLLGLSGSVDYTITSANVDDYQGDSCAGVAALPIHWGNSPDLVYCLGTSIPAGDTLTVWTCNATYDVVLYARYNNCQTGPQAGCIAAPDSVALEWVNTTANAQSVCIFVDGDSSVGSATLYWCINCDRTCPPPTGITDMNSIDDIHILPNPCNGEFTLTMEPSNQEALQLRILNLLGQVVYNESLPKTSARAVQVISLAKEDKGLFILQVLSETGAVNKKIIVR